MDKCVQNCDLKTKIRLNLPVLIAMKLAAWAVCFTSPIEMPHWIGDSRGWAGGMGIKINRTETLCILLIGGEKKQ